MFIESNYAESETRFIVNGFRFGFPIGYEGPTKRKQTARNIPLKCGSQQDLWDKMMKEVKLKRFAGPYSHVLFKSYIQSPVGLVPKHQTDQLDQGQRVEDQGQSRLNQTRLIFHLSYPDQASLNHFTPRERCRMKYKDLDHAVKLCLKTGQGCYLANSDI